MSKIQSSLLSVVLFCKIDCKICCLQNIINTVVFKPSPRQFLEKHLLSLKIENISVENRRTKRDLKTKSKGSCEGKRKMSTFV